MANEQLIDLSAFDKARFVDLFGGIYEHSAWVAEAAWDQLVNTSTVSTELIALRFKQLVDSATREQKLALLKAHPELAGKAATEGTLTAESTQEQASARLDLCSPTEFKRFHELNSQYNAKFDFPFILAVRNRTRSEVLAAFEARVTNAPDEEFVRALEQVHQIAVLRLAAMDVDHAG